MSKHEIVGVSISPVPRIVCFSPESIIIFSICCWHTIMCYTFKDLHHEFLWNSGLKLTEIEDNDNPREIEEGEKKGNTSYMRQQNARGAISQHLRPTFALAPVYTDHIFFFFFFISLLSLSLSLARDRHFETRSLPAGGDNSRNLAVFISSILWLFLIRVLGACAYVQQVVIIIWVTRFVNLFFFFLFRTRVRATEWKFSSYLMTSRSKFRGPFFSKIKFTLPVYFVGEVFQNHCCRSRHETFTWFWFLS